MREAGVVGVVGLVLAAAALTACGGNDNALFTGAFRTTIASTAPASEVAMTDTTDTVAAAETTVSTTLPGTTVAPSTTAAPTTTLAALTFAEIGAMLNGPASAYITSRGGAAEAEALRVAAADVLATGRATGLAPVATPDGEASASVVLEFVASQPDFVWVKALERGGVLSGLPVFFLDGVYRVGTEVLPGDYEAFDVEYCFWQRIDPRGGQIDSFYTEGAPRAAATVAATDYGFASKDCGVWFRIG